MSTVLSIEEVYREILDGKRKRFPNGTWEEHQYVSRCVKYLFEEVLKWSDEEI